jgi:outer membrane protein assembly factor BamB
VYSATTLPRRLLLPGATALLALGAHPAPRPPLFPMAPAWKTLLGDFVTPPLALDGKRLYVATRDGALRALDAGTGEPLWKVEGLPGRVSASDGVVLVRGPEGRLTSLQPRNGGVRWSVETKVTGTLPALIDEDRVLVAGGGLSAIDRDSGRVLWTRADGIEASAPPVRAGSRWLTGEADGTLHSRDRATGASLWTLRTGRALLAPPLVDGRRQRLYLGTADKRILAASLRDGHPGWHWTVGADVADPGLLLPGKVLFASYDAVLYALRRGGNLAWRAPLPSRPLSGPIEVAGYLLVACLEDQLVGIDPDTGDRVGAMRTSAEIRTAPIVTSQHVVLGLRDRSLIAYTRPDVPAAPAPEPAKVEAAPSGR